MAAVITKRLRIRLETARETINNLSGLELVDKFLGALMEEKVAVLQVRMQMHCVGEVKSL